MADVSHNLWIPEDLWSERRKNTRWRGGLRRIPCPVWKDRRASWAGSSSTRFTACPAGTSEGMGGPTLWPNDDEDWRKKRNQTNPRSKGRARSVRSDLDSLHMKLNVSPSGYTRMTKLKRIFICRRKASTLSICCEESVCGVTCLSLYWQIYAVYFATPLFFAGCCKT